MDVERSFSAHRLILSDKRKKLTPQNLEELVVGYCAPRLQNLLFLLYEVPYFLNKRRPLISATLYSVPHIDTHEKISAAR